MRSNRQQAIDSADIFGANRSAIAETEARQQRMYEIYRQTLASQSGQFAQPRINHNQTYSLQDTGLTNAINQSNLVISKLKSEIKQTPDDEKLRTNIKGKIKEELEKQYDAYLEHHEKPLKRLEERLEKLRSEFEQRKNAKEELVKHKLDGIWYSAIGLGWPGSSGQSVMGGSSYFQQPAKSDFGPFRPEEFPTSAPVERFNHRRTPDIPATNR